MATSRPIRTEIDWRRRATQSTPFTTNSGGSANYYEYCRSVNGAKYKVIRKVPSGSVPAIEFSGNNGLDPARGMRGWGYLSAGG